MCVCNVGAILACLYAMGTGLRQEGKDWGMRSSGPWCPWVGEKGWDIMHKIGFYWPNDHELHLQSYRREGKWSEHLGRWGGWVNGEMTGCGISLLVASTFTIKWKQMFSRVRKGENAMEVWRGEKVRDHHLQGHRSELTQEIWQNCLG